MKRFLCTTAIVAGFAGTAIAGSDYGTKSEASMEKSYEFGAMQAQQNDFFASDLIGMRIYNSENDYENNATVAAGSNTEWDDIGEINDLIISQSGEVRGVILGIGGFIGLGEHDVSVSMDDIRVLTEDGGDRFLVVKTDQETLENAPEFDRTNFAMETEEEDGVRPAQNTAATTVSPEMDSEDSVVTETASTEPKQGHKVDQVEAELEETGNELERDAETALNNAEEAGEELQNDAANAIEETGDEIENAADNAEAEIEEEVDTSELETETETTGG